MCPSLAVGTQCALVGRLMPAAPLGKAHVFPGNQSFRNQPPNALAELLTTIVDDDVEMPSELKLRELFSEASFVACLL